MSSVRRGRLTMSAAAVLVVFGLGLAGLAGCSGRSAEDSGGGTAGYDQQSGNVGEAAPAPAAEKDAGAGAQPEQGQPGTNSGVDLRVDQRSIIYTGSITVRVDDVSKKAAEAISLATAGGGFVGGDKRTSNPGYEEAVLVLRVPADRFGSVVDKIAALGEQENRDVNTQDVTEEVVDLEARIATQEARVASGRRLLASAKTLGDLVMLEGEVAKREADLASLKAKKTRLDDLTALSTITVTLVDREAPAVVEEETLGFLAGLRGGWNAFLGSLQVALTVLGALIPWLIAVGVPVLAVLWFLRRRRSAAATAVPPPPADPA